MAETNLAPSNGSRFQPSLNGRERRPAGRCGPVPGPPPSVPSRAPGPLTVGSGGRTRRGGRRGGCGRREEGKIPEHRGHAIGLHNKPFQRGGPLQLQGQVRYAEQDGVLNGQLLIRIGQWAGRVDSANRWKTRRKRQAGAASRGSGTPSELDAGKGRAATGTAEHSGDCNSAMVATR